MDESEGLDGPVLDLDELISEPVYFKLLGVKRALVPYSLQAFLKTANAQAELSKVAHETTGIKELAEAYFKLFDSCIEPITLDEVYQMRPQQCAALLALIIRRQYGEDLAKTYDQKKKITPIPQRPISAQLASLQKPRFFSDGPQESA